MEGGFLNWDITRHKKHHFSPVRAEKEETKQFFLCRGIVVDVTTKLSVADRWDGNCSKISTITGHIT